MAQIVRGPVCVRGVSVWVHVRVCTCVCTRVCMPERQYKRKGAKEEKGRQLGNREDEKGVELLRTAVVS